MKKDPLNLINIDINYFKLFFLRKIIFLYFVATFFICCDDTSLSPTWYTTINLPLTTTEVLFSDIVDDCAHIDENECNSDLSDQCSWVNEECINYLFTFTIDENGEIITMLFEDAIIDYGDIGLNEDLINFSIDPIDLEADQSIQENFNLNSFNNLGYTSDPIDVSLDLGLDSPECVPKTFVQSSFDVNDLIQSGDILLPVDQIESFFSEYEYMTLDQFEIIKEITSTLPFDLEFDISISGENIIYSSIDIVGDNIDSSGVYNKIHNISNSIQYSLEISIPENQNYCNSTIPLDLSEENCIDDLEWKNEYCMEYIDAANYNFIFDVNKEDCIDIENNIFWIQESPYCIILLDETIDESIVSEVDCQQSAGQWIDFSDIYQPVCYEQSGFNFSNNDNYNLSFGFAMDNINIKSIKGIINLDSFNNDLNNQIIPLTTFDNDGLSFELRGAKLTDNIENVNKLALNYENNSPLELKIEIILNNFEKNSSVIQETINIIPQTISAYEILLNDAFFLHEDNVGTDNPDPNKTIENIQYSINLLPQESKEYLLEDLNNIDIFIGNIHTETLEFEYLTAAVEEITMDTPSASFDNIPSGFEGLVFSNPTMEIEISNQIGIGSDIEMHLVGENEFQEEVELEIIGKVFESLDYSENPEAQNSCLRVIDNCVCSFRGSCEEFNDAISCEECEQQFNEGNEDYVYNSSVISLSQFLQHGPAILSVSDESKATLSGTGRLYPNTYIWGDFSLIAPFSLIIGNEVEDCVEDVNAQVVEDLDLMPSDPTELAAMDQSTKDMIDNALIEASIVSNIENNSFIMGNASIMVSSNESFFPLNIDQAILLLNECDALSEELGTCLDEVKINLINDFLDNDYLNNIINSIDRINFSKIDDSKIKLIEFLDDNIVLLEYGRLIEFILPGPSALDDNPIFDPPFLFDNYFSKMDAIQLEMINQSNSEKFINTILSLQNSYDLNDDGCLDNENGIINIYNDNYINIQTYMSFIVNPSGF